MNGFLIIQLSEFGTVSCVLISIEILQEITDKEGTVLSVFEDSVVFNPSPTSTVLETNAQGVWF